MPPSVLADDPWVIGGIRQRRVIAVLPFAAVAVIGQLSAEWPPAPNSDARFWASCALLVASVLVILLPGQTSMDTRNVWLLAALTYLASVAYLMLATGGVASGLGSLLLIPVVAVALYGRRFDSLIVVGGVLAAQGAISSVATHVDSETVRRVVLFGSMCVMLSIGIHLLRERLVASNKRTVGLLRRAEATNVAAEDLASLLDPEAIMALGVRLSEKIIGPKGLASHSIWYLRIVDGTVRVEAESGAGSSTGSSWSLAGDRALLSLERTKKPVFSSLESLTPEPSSAVFLRREDLSSCAWLPVSPEGELHGALVIARRARPLGRDSLASCVALTRFLELALSNWEAHRELASRATAEERRRIARELHDGLAHELAFIASKTKQPKSEGPSSVDLRELAEAADRALDEARRAITVLSRATPQSLPAAIAQTAEDLGARLDVSVELELRDETNTSSFVTENLLRIVREAMVNSAKHGHCRRITITLQGTDHPVVLTVADDGCGFDVTGRSPNRGFGILGMEERAKAMGAELLVDSSSAGTKVQVLLP
jgi:signal transduction histidine kinase